MNVKLLQNKLYYVPFIKTETTSHRIHISVFFKAVFVNIKAFSRGAGHQPVR
jgi:hypothetical protein